MRSYFLLSVRKLLYAPMQIDKITQWMLCILGERFESIRWVNARRTLSGVQCEYYGSKNWIWMRCLNDDALVSEQEKQENRELKLNAISVLKSQLPHLNSTYVFNGLSDWILDLNAARQDAKQPDKVPLFLSRIRRICFCLHTQPIRKSDRTSPLHRRKINFSSDQITIIFFLAPIDNRRIYRSIKN